MFALLRPYRKNMFPVTLVLGTLILASLYYPAFAKGVSRSGSDSDRGRSGSSQSEDRGRVEKQESNRNNSNRERSRDSSSGGQSVSSRSEERRADPAPRRVDPEPRRVEPDRGRAEQDRSRVEPNRGRVETFPTERQTPERVVPRRSEPDSRNASPTLPQVRSESRGSLQPSTRNSGADTSRVQPRRVEPQDRSVYRKEYDNVGRIWMERSERRSRRHDDSDWRRNDGDRRGTTINIYNYYPGKYRYYRYSYEPGIVFPSLYCYYYGYFPPYIPRERIVFLTPSLGITYTYWDLPDVVLRYDSPDWDRYYYYHPQRSFYRSLSYTLRDIERAWERSDIDLLMKHVRRNNYIDIYLGDEYSYSVDSQDYYEMTQDALSSIRTADFAFTRVRQRGDSEAVAYGRHTYQDYEDDSYNSSSDYGYYDNRSKRTIYVKYTLHKYGGEWYITEVGSSPDSRYY